jgi:asparagine synthase (glutamine-hydrolysing)
LKKNIVGSPPLTSGPATPFSVALVAFTFVALLVVAVGGTFVQYAARTRFDAGSARPAKKAALEPLLTREIVHRKERGFITPIDRWLRTEMQASARSLLLAPDAHCAHLFRRSAIEQLLRRHGAGEFDHTRQLFCLLSFELWARRFLDA